MSTSEKIFERRLREQVKAWKGIALKIWCISFTGIPDRLILLPGGSIDFVELKSTGKKPHKRQPYVIAMLRALGFRVWVIDSETTLNEFFKSKEI